MDQCGSDVPAFQVDTQNDYPGDPDQPVLDNYVYIDVRDQPTPWSDEHQGWTMAFYDQGAAGVGGRYNRIRIFTRCPSSQQQDEHQAGFAYCGDQGFVDWSQTGPRLIAAHELGHALGLGHDDCAKSIMQAVDPGGTIYDSHCKTAQRLNQTVRSVGVVLKADGLNAADHVVVQLYALTADGEFAADAAVQVLGDPGESLLPFRDSRGSVRLESEWSCTASVTFNKNERKSCSVAPSSGEVAMNEPDPLVIELTCECDNGQPDCFESASHILEPFVQDEGAVEDVCDPFWNICDEDEPWWWPEGSCRRATQCQTRTVRTTIVGEDGKEKVVLSEVYDCTDGCGGAAATAPSLFELLAPRTSLVVPAEGSTVSGREVAVSGWAQDPDGLRGLLFHVDFRVVHLADYRYGLLAPVACSGPGAPPGCDPNSGFVGTLDVCGLAPGPHLVQVLAVDAAPVLPTVTVAQHAIVVRDDPPVPRVEVTCDDTDCRLRAASSTDDCGIVGVEWQLDDGRVFPETGRLLPEDDVVTSFTLGIHRVTLVATDTRGQIAAVSISFEVALAADVVFRDGFESGDLSFWEICTEECPTP